MPPSPKVRNVTENNVIQQEGDKVTAPVSSASYGANIKIISSVSSPAGQRTVMKTNQIKAIHNLVTTQERKPVLVDTPISLRTSKNEAVKCSGSITSVTLPAGTQVIPNSNHQVYYSGIITSTCPTPTTSVGTIPKTAILMPHGHYTLLNAPGVKGGALVAPGGSSPMQVTNVMVKTNPAVPVGTQSGITKGVSVGSGQPTHVQYLVPSFTSDGKLILPSNLLVPTDPAAKQLTVTPVSSAGGVRMVPSTGGAATSDAGGVIKPLTVTEVAKTSVTSQAQGMVLISGTRSGIAPVGPQLGVSQPVSLPHSPYQTHPAGESSP